MSWEWTREISLTFPSLLISKLITFCLVDLSSSVCCQRSSAPSFRSPSRSSRPPTSASPRPPRPRPHTAREFSLLSNCCAIASTSTNMYYCREYTTMGPVALDHPSLLCTDSVLCKRTVLIDACSLNYCMYCTCVQARARRSRPTSATCSRRWCRWRCSRRCRRLTRAAKPPSLPKCSASARAPRCSTGVLPLSQPCPFHHLQSSGLYCLPSVRGRLHYELRIALRTSRISTVQYSMYYENVRVLASRVRVITAFNADVIHMWLHYIVTCYSCAYE